MYTEVCSPVSEEMAFTLTVQEGQCLVDGSNLQREIFSKLTVNPEIKLLDLSFKYFFKAVITKCPSRHHRLNSQHNS